MIFHERMGTRSLVSVESAHSRVSRLVTFAVALLFLFAAGILEVQTATGFHVSTDLCGTLVLPWGYPCNEYTVETDDGFLLGVQNIPNGILQEQNGASGPPVFLLHGLFAGGDNWVFNNPSESLGFILADAGYDVWIGNIRAIMWSHGHVSLTTDDEKYWDWSWDELAAYDLPAMLGFVYTQTGSKVVYIGHSQGTTVLMGGVVGTAQSQAVTVILAGAVLLCPIAFMNNITSTFDKLAADLYVDNILNVFGIDEFHLYNELGVELVQDVCVIDGANCTNLYRAVTGNDCCINYTRIPFFLNFFPQSTSSRNLGHFAQMIRTNTFSKYDFGFIGNLETYGRLTPPPYDLSSFPSSVPLMIVQGGQDSLADPSNVQALVTLLGTKVTKHVNVENYAHGDFVVSTTANVDIYPDIISFVESSHGVQVEQHMSI